MTNLYFKNLIIFLILNTIFLSFVRCGGAGNSASNPPLSAPFIESISLVTVDSSENQSNGSSILSNTNYDHSFSADGSYIAFSSFATNLVAGDTNGRLDVFVRDLKLGVTTLASVTTSGAQGGSDSYAGSLSGDGRYLAFISNGDDLVAGDMNGEADIFVRDFELGVTTLVSISSNGTQGDGLSVAPSISFDGRYVVFHSNSTNLVSGDTNGVIDVFLHDRQTGVTSRVSEATGNIEANNASVEPKISDNGRYVVYYSNASNLVSGDTNSANDVFVYDHQTEVTSLVSVSSSGTKGNRESALPSISGNGRFVVFMSFATNLVSGDTNGSFDIFTRDLQTGTTSRVSVSSSGVQSDEDSDQASISKDARYVVFKSTASNLTSIDTNMKADIFVRDRQAGTTQRVSVSANGVEANNDSNWPVISPDGRYVLFSSESTNLISQDTNGFRDVYVTLIP